MRSSNLARRSGTRLDLLDLQFMISRLGIFVEIEQGYRVVRHDICKIGAWLVEQDIHGAMSVVTVLVPDVCGIRYEEERGTMFKSRSGID
jgi:hypothetical protein